MAAQSTLSTARTAKLLFYLTLLGRVVFILRISRFLFVDGFRHVRARGVTGSVQEIYNYFKAIVIRIILSLPSSRAKLASELAKTRVQIQSKLAPNKYPDGIDLTPVRTLPEHGRDREWLKHEWRGMKGLEKGDVQEGRVSGAVYHGGEELNSIINEAMAQFVVSNPLHPSVFPGVRKMEAEIVSICLNLFNGPKGAGTTTSGGTESILMSVKTHRDWAKAVKGITKPEMVIPASAHAAFWKASEYFGIKLHVIPVIEATRKADVAWIKRAINPNTIMIVGSAPNFPDGIIDPIPALGRLAKRYNIGLHVDCCLGSFIVPFLERAGLSEGVEKFDFRVPGVTAISCDTHKYAFCPKGSSVIMYHSPELRRYQYYVITDWAGGIYASPSMAGSRPGSVLAGAWAVLNYMGNEGYTSSCKDIVGAARGFAQSLRTQFSDDLYILGEPQVSVVAFNSRTVNIYAVGDILSDKGWHLSALGPPAGGLHMAFTRLTAMSVAKLLNDLEQAIKEAKLNPKEDGDMVALYGLGQTTAGPHVVGKVAEIFIDTLYE
ncbi:putative sphinganine-1-phosphate aldolase [Naematelia encephala]|uniref:sphinganine-1-phosphate aldolase n=1 Tax=Naematelia encephala TaxID=71784 RepID=A0A1Y2AJF0_9TREE|nr:putative sphinganine-1-phosphate aldolase [Naematelia encephala]